jgi:hypothetical protein
LSDRAATTKELAEAIYTDTPKALIPAARRNILSHLVDLYVKKEVAPLGELTADAAFRKL